MNLFRPLALFAATLASVSAFAQIDEEALRSMAFILPYEHRYSMEDSAFYDRLMKSEIARVEAKIKAGSATAIDYYDKGIAEDYIEDYDASGASLEKAVGILEERIKKAEGDPIENDLYLALCQTELGEYAKAATIARNVTEKHPENAFGHAVLSHVVATHVLYELGKVIDYELMATDLYIALDELIEALPDLGKLPQEQLDKYRSQADSASASAKQGVRLAPKAWESYRYQEAAIVLDLVLKLVKVHQEGGDEIGQAHNELYAAGYEEMMSGLRLEAIYTKGSRERQLFDLLNAAETFFENAYEKALAEDGYEEDLETSGFFGALKENVPEELKGMAKELIAHLEKAYQEQPPLEPAATALCIAYLWASRGEETKAVEWTQKAASHDPEWIEPTVALGTFLMEGERDKCKEALTKALEKKEDPYLRMMLAYLYELDEDYAGVEKQYAILLKSDKENISYRLGVAAAKILQDSSDLDEDYEFLKKAYSQPFEDEYEKHMVMLHYGIIAGLKGNIAEAKEAFTALSKSTDEDWSSIGKSGLVFLDGESRLITAATA